MLQEQTGGFRVGARTKWDNLGDRNITEGSPELVRLEVGIMLFGKI